MQQTNRVPKRWGSSDLRIVSSRPKPGGGRYPSPVNGLFILLLLSVVVIGYYFIDGDPASPTVINEDGKEELAPERKRKLDKELDEIDHAIQYALVAGVDGYYPCFTCPDGSPTLFLYKKEIWRYGMTRKGEQGRYPNGNYGAPNLIFSPQFMGTYADCLKMEKIKIYNYPLLPEAKKRSVKLFRPPGNATDR